MRIVLAFLLLFPWLASADITYGAGWSSLQAAVTAAAGQKLIIPAGSYAITTLTVSSNTVIESQGPVTFTSSSNAAMLDFTSATDWTFRGDFTLIGNGATYTGYGTGPSDAGQIGIKLYNSARFTIDGRIVIRNISGACIDAQAPSLAFTAITGTIRGLQLSSCYRGAWARNYAEYLTFSDIIAYSNVFGIQVDSGNNTFVNAKAVYNSIGVKICGSNNSSCNSTGNNGHGIFVGLESNHNTYNLTMVDVSLGMTFSASHFLSDQSGSGHGLIQIINSKVNITGGQLGSDISLDATSVVSVQSNYVRTDLANTPSVTSGGVLYSKQNTISTGAAWAGNN